MPTVTAPIEVEAGATTITEAAVLATISTTLYDLMAAIQDVVGPDDDALVIATVAYMLCSGRVTRGSEAVAYHN